MTRVLQGRPEARETRVALIVARFNDVVTDRLLAGAQACLDHHGGGADTRTVVYVPGAWEVPLVARTLAESGQYDAIVGLGALIRGETAHFDVLATAVAHGLAEASQASGVPMAFGVLTTETVEQALERSADGEDNKGWEAARSAIELADLYRRLG